PVGGERVGQGGVCGAGVGSSHATSITRTPAVSPGLAEEHGRKLEPSSSSTPTERPLMSALFPDHRPSWETDDHRLLRDHARAFFAKEMTPNQEKWAEQKYVDRETWMRTGEAGLICLDVPEEYGGQGGDPAMEYLVTEELVYSGDTAFGMGVGSTITPHYVVNYRSEEHTSELQSRFDLVCRLLLGQTKRDCR